MTPEQLERAVEAGDQDDVIRLIAAASEEDRRRAAPTAVRLKRELFDRYLRNVSRDFAKKEAAFVPQDQAAGLAVLGTCTLAEMRKLRGLDNREAAVPCRAFEILSARRPNWLNDWAEWKMQDGCRWTSYERTSPWLVVRSLIRAGLIARPASDGYIISMISCAETVAYHRMAEMHRRGSQIQASERLHIDVLYEIVNNDPELLDAEIWRLFEVEGTDGVSLASMGGTWQPFLLELCAANRLDRQRLLTCSLEALQRDFSPFHAGWFSRFHEELKPTPDERAARSDTYLALLGSAVPATVSFALKALAALDKAGRLSEERLMVSIAPALTAREKGTAALALRLLDRAAKRNEDLRTEAALIACEALEHASIDVQRQAIDLLETYGAMADPAVRSAVEQRLPAVSPSLHSRTAALLPLEDGVETMASEEANLNAGLEGLLHRAEQLDPALARLAGIVEALRAVRIGEPAFTGLTLPFHDTPRLDPARRQIPITNLDDLIDLFASVLENDGPADDIERVLDGVSRLCGERPFDFERRTSALRKRAETLIGTQLPTLLNGQGIHLDLVGLALAWTTGKVHGGGLLLKHDRFWGECLPEFLSARVIEIALNAANHRSRPLLAAPTSAGGWIDPLVAVERFRRRTDLSPLPKQAAGFRSDTIPFWRGFPDLCDIVQALLRIAPDRRTEALRLATDLRGEPGAALRYALGANDVSIGPTLPLWIAAARARAPKEDDSRVEHRFPQSGPGGGRAGQAHIGWHTSTEPSHNYGQIYCDPPVSEDTHWNLPTVLHFRLIHYARRWHFNSVPYVRWLTTTWPQYRYPWWIAGTLSFGRNLDWIETLRGDVVILEMLIDPDEPITEAAANFLAVALAAKEPGQSTAAIDVLIAAISDTRLDGATLGLAMTATLQIEPLKPQRWAKTLGEAGRASLLHAFVIHEAIEQMLASVPHRPAQQMIGLFELLVELAAQTGKGIASPQARASIELIAGTGSGKAARLAKTLLSLPVSDNATRGRSAAMQILASRIERAERWQRAAAADSTSRIQSDALETDDQKR